MVQQLHLWLPQCLCYLLVELRKGIFLEIEKVGLAETEEENSIRNKKCDFVIVYSCKKCDFVIK